MHHVDNESVRSALLRRNGETPVEELVAASAIAAEFHLGMPQLPATAT